MEPTKQNVGTQAEPHIVPILKSTAPIKLAGEVQEIDPTTDVSTPGPSPSLPPGFKADEWEDVTPKSAGAWEDVTPRPAALVALDGTRHTTDKAIQLLDEAARTGYGAEHFAGEGTIADPGTPGYQHILQTFRQ